MSAIYDNWERLVTAVLKREEIWQLCHQNSRSSTVYSESSDFSSYSFRLSGVSMLEKEEELVSVPKLILVGIHLKDALKSSTQRLGNRRFGTYILTELVQDVQLSDQEFLAKGTQLVMKKLVNENAIEEKIKQKMMVLGNCRHENVDLPRAYYFSDETNGKFTLNDYHSQGNVFDMLHGQEFGMLGDCLSWRSRLKVAIGAARGIAHIHRQCGGKMAHGNIKSSNIFLNSQQYGCVSDVGLAGIMVKPQKRGALVYSASNYEFKNATQEGDVYSFGVMLLELLTRKSPTDIDAWARSTRSNKRISKLFDQSFRGRGNVDEKDMLEMVLKIEIQGGDSATILQRFSPSLRSTVIENVEMMQVGMRCLSMFPKDRPKMSDVVLMLENIAISDEDPEYVEEELV